jgi:Family of unknown function (DUF6152)
MSLHRTFLTALVLSGLIAAPLRAHHSVAKEFDETKATIIQGVITKVELVNPHAWITLESKDANGSISNWHLEIASPNALIRSGIRAGDFELAKSCSMEIWPSRDGSKTANGRTLTFANGRTFDVHDTFPIPPGPPIK